MNCREIVDMVWRSWITLAVLYIALVVCFLYATHWTGL